MTILRDIRVSLTPEGVLLAQRRNQRATLNPALASIATEAIAIGQAIASPSAIYDEFQMQGTVGEQAVISADRSDEQPENERYSQAPAEHLHSISVSCSS